jgi:hypothetical protein
MNRVCVRHIDQASKLLELMSTTRKENLAELVAEFKRSVDQNRAREHALLDELHLEERLHEEEAERCSPSEQVKQLREEQHLASEAALPNAQDEAAAVSNAGKLGHTSH